MTLQAPLGIVVAMEAERRTLAKLAGSMIELSGPGPRNAAAAAERLQARGARLLVSWGTAGALVPELPPGALLVSATTTQDSGPDNLHHDHKLADAIAEACAALRPTRGTVCSVSRPACQRSAKEALNRISGALVVDMESAAVAAVAHRAGLPFAAVRAVVDPVGFELPPAALAGLREDGSSSVWPVLVALLRQPGQLGSLCRLGLHFRSALRALEAVAAHLASTSTAPFGAPP